MQVLTFFYWIKKQNKKNPHLTLDSFKLELILITMKSHPEQPRYIYTFPFHKTVLIKKAK